MDYDKFIDSLGVADFKDLRHIFELEKQAEYLFEEGEPVVGYRLFKGEDANQPDKLSSGYGALIGREKAYHVLEQSTEGINIDPTGNGFYFNLTEERTNLLLRERARGLEGTRPEDRICNNKGFYVIYKVEGIYKPKTFRETDAFGIKMDEMKTIGEPLKFLKFEDIPYRPDY